MRKLKNTGTKSLGIRTLLINGRELTGELEVTEYRKVKEFDCNNSYGVVKRDFAFYPLGEFAVYVRIAGGKWESL